MAENRYGMGPRRLTGRKLVVLSPGANRATVTRALAGTGIRLRGASELGELVPTEVLREAEITMFDRLDILLVARPTAEATGAIAALGAEGQILAVEDESYVDAIGEPAPDPLETAYLRGYRDGVDDLAHRVATEPQALPGDRSRRARPVPETAAERCDESGVTWGLSAIGAYPPVYTGRGVKVAILDTGVCTQHIDFVDREVVARSFVQGDRPGDVDDWHGHGTHTAGVACGRRSPSSLAPRYGVAPEAALYIAKVLDGCGVGTDGSILQGINWALEQGCRVLSMSLGVPLDEPMMTYVQVGRLALRNDALIVAAAGNDSARRRGVIAPTRSPANAGTIMAVAAVDARGDVADFSNGGKIEIAAPGVDVYASYRCNEYRCLSGTSMAAPHVAGVAALLMEAYPDATAQEIWRLLITTARPLAASKDVGAGLVEAPQRPCPSAPAKDPARALDGREPPSCRAVLGD